MGKVLKIWIKFTIITIAILVLFLLVSVIRHKICSLSEKVLLTPLGELVEVDGHNMSIFVEGKGKHTLVFLSGGGTCCQLTKEEYEFLRIRLQLYLCNIIIVL
ncbi:MAG: hypothetical protein HXL74_04435 [[Eubacterium] brachy]|nr:hypothetical protein [[Eubacterium] brachy]